MSWGLLVDSEPELAAKGRRLFERRGEKGGESGGVPLGYLATVSKAGDARIAPVCPIFCDNDVYLSVGRHTPKAHDLALVRSYALHAPLATHDEEFQISGAAELVTSTAEARRVHAAIAFPVFSAADPVFRLAVLRCLWSLWDEPAERPSRRLTWRAGGRST